MSFSMVEVFNQLTRKELADCNFSTVEELLGSHYEKFKLFYKGCKSVPKEIYKSMKYVSCYSSDEGILIELEFKSKKNCQLYREKMESSLLSEEYCTEGYIKSSIEFIDSKKINISIENNNISGEDEIYENRFDTY